MNDALLMRMLDGLTDLREKVQPIFSGKIMLIAVVGDFDTAHEFHDEVRRPVSVAPASSTLAMFG